MSTAVVYCLHGKTVWRLRRSIASLRRAGVASDIVLLSLGGDTVGDAYVLSQCKCVVSVDKLLGDLGFNPGGWNRPWGYGSLSPLAMPLVPELSRYDRALLVESDVLALSPRFTQWLDWPTRGFEVIGAAGDLHTVSAVGRSDDVEVDRCFADASKVSEMRSRIWNRNPPYTHTHINPGVCLWDLALLRSDIGWYRTRLRWFWEGILHGQCVYLLESFVNVFMDCAALLDVSMHEKSDGLGSKFVPAAARHFNRLAYTDDPHNAFNAKARELGLDDAIARTLAPAAQAAAAVPSSREEVPAGKCAVVYITDGNKDDQQRLVWSLRSIARNSKARFDTVILSASGMPDVAASVPEVLAHGEVKHVRDMDKTLAGMSITDKYWNRGWPFVVLHRLGIPLHPAFAGYDRVLYLDTDTLVLSDRVDRFISADLRGFEIGGVVDVVQERHGRIRNTLEHDLREDNAKAVLDRYGEQLLYRAYVNAGVMLWNLAEIRKDIEWYKRRLAMFWEAECRGKFGFLDQDFINAMMAVKPSFSMVYNWITGSGPDTDACVVRHYSAKQYAAMRKKAEGLGLVNDKKGGMDA